MPATQLALSFVGLVRCFYRSNNTEQVQESTETGSEEKSYFKYGYGTGTGAFQKVGTEEGTGTGHFTLRGVRNGYGFFLS